MTPQEHAAEAVRMAEEAAQRPASSPAAGTYALRGLLHAALAVAGWNAPPQWVEPDEPDVCGICGAMDCKGHR